MSLPTIGTVPTTHTPDNPNALYVRLMYHTYFFGPFESVEAVADGLRQLDAADPMWDYDCFCVHYGANPLSTCFVTGFKFVDSTTRDRIEALRGGAA